LEFISDFFATVLRWVFSLVQNYSVAIIIVTVAIRVLILPLDLKQKKSSRKMALIQPKIDSLKKRYSNNPQMLQKKQQELFKKEGVKPLAGCLPMLLTLPIFFAFFAAMRVLAAEQTVSFMLNAQNLGESAYSLPSWLWVHNFWQPDSGFSSILPSAVEFTNFVQSNAQHISPQSLHMLNMANLVDFNPIQNALQQGAAYSGFAESIITSNDLVGFNNGWFILPILAGVSLFVQTKLTASQTGAAGQGKFMLWFFPIFSVYICAISNTAFAIYWLFANLYALAQTLIVNLIYKKRDEKKRQGIIEEAT